MNRLQRAAILLSLIERLRERGSWCGETHIQKAVYFLQELAGGAPGFDYILYKHGPFSFDLRDELTACRADGLLDIFANPVPYGPSLYPTKAGRSLIERYPKTVGEYRKVIDFVAESLAVKRVSELERLATALYANSHKEQLAIKDGTEDIARRINELKPHVSVEDAMRALAEIETFFNKAPAGAY